MDVSVIVISFNNERHISEALDSVLAQTKQPSEIIVADDASTDRTPEIIREYAKDYPNLIRPFLHDENKGIPGNLNFAIDKASHELVTFFGGDDRWLPWKIEREHNTLLDTSDADVVFSNYRTITTDGEPVDTWVELGLSPPTGDVFKESFSREWPKNSLYRNPMIKATAFEELGGFDEELQTWEEWDFKIRLSFEYEVAYCPEVLIEHRINPDGIGRSTSAEYGLRNMKRVYKKNEHLLSELPPEERMSVERRLSRHFTKREVRIQVRNGSRGKALKNYARLISKFPELLPSEIIDYKFLARLFLPNPLYRGVRTGYQKMRS